MCTRFWIEVERWETCYCAATAVPANWQRRNARDRVLLAQERDADRPATGRRAIDDRARHVVVVRTEDVRVGAGVEVVVLAVERSRVGDSSHVQARVVERRPRVDGHVPGRGARGPEDQPAEGEDRGRGRVRRGVERDLRGARARGPGRSTRPLRPCRSNRPLRARKPAGAPCRRDNRGRELRVPPERDEPARPGRPRRLDPVHRSGVPGERDDRAARQRHRPAMRRAGALRRRR